MEGFDKIYLLRKNGTPKRNFGYSRIVTLKDYFQKYSDELSSIMPKSSVEAKTMLRNILQDEEEITTEELHNIRADIKKKLFTHKNCYLEWLEVNKKKEMNTSSVPDENASINPKESSPLVFGEERPSTSKDRDENESVIYSITVDSESEEETCIPSTSRGRDEYDSRDGTITATQIDGKNTSNMLKGRIKTYERRKYGKVVPKCKGKIYETQGNDKQRTSIREIEKKSKLITDTLPSLVKQSNVIEQTLGNKVDLFSVLNEAISDDTRGSKKPSNSTRSNFADFSIEKEANLLDNCNETSIEKEHLRSPSEAIDTVTQILDTLILNIESISSIESIDTANKAKFKSPEVPVRRGGQKIIPKKAFDYHEDYVKKIQAEKEAKLTVEKVRIKYNLPEFGDGDSSSISSTIRRIRNRNILKTKRFRSARGTILVNTTKKLGDKDLSPRKNFVVSFRIHKPFNQHPGKKNIRPARCQQEIEVLNFQTLDDLRLKISCESDYQYLSGDVSDWPYNPRTEVAKEKYKGAMFYINNTFYINTEEGATDYSEVIRKWAEDRGINVGETKPMNSIKIEDLQPRMGYPYVYVHQGSCEHLVIISRARLLLEKSSLHSSDYPNLTKISKSPVYYCVTCAKIPARWIVVGSHLMPHDVNFMCEKCYHRYLYIRKTKIGNFKAYYFQQRALLFY